MPEFRWKSISTHIDLSMKWDASGHPIEGGRDRGELADLDLGRFEIMTTCAFQVTSPKD